jgi:hypothetical protein
MAGWLRAIGEARPAAMIQDYKRGLREEQRAGMEQERFGMEKERMEEWKAERPTREALSGLQLQQAQRERGEIERKAKPGNINKHLDQIKVPDQFRKEIMGIAGTFGIDPETGIGTMGQIEDFGRSYLMSPKAAEMTKRIAGLRWSEYTQAKTRYDEAVKGFKDEKTQIKLRQKMEEAEKEFMAAAGINSQIMQMQQKIQQLQADSQAMSQEAEDLF